jgi:cytochrome b561
MSLKMKRPDYSGLQKLLHWLSAIVILWALISGFYVSLFDVPFAVKEWVVFVNVSLTMLYLPFFVLRLYLSFGCHRSAGAHYRSPSEYLALCVHRLIYLVVGVVLVTGILMMDRAISVFDLFFIPQPLDNPDFIALSVTVHVWACLLLALLIALHITAVIKHEVSGNRVLNRMCFRTLARKTSTK